MTQKETNPDPLSITNGCGPDGFSDSTSVFAPACAIHDYDYSFSNNQPSSFHRKAADDRFLKNMLKIAEELSWHQKLLRQAQAYLFYGLVRLFGQNYYNPQKLQKKEE